jgi:hypothetical protein
VGGHVTGSLLALGAFLVILIVVWVVTVKTLGERERRRAEGERLRHLQMEAELRALRKSLPPQRDKWLLDARGMEALRAQAPDWYPPLTGGQTPEEFWDYWTPDRVDEWREKRGLPT